MPDPVTYLFKGDVEYALFDGFYYKLTRVALSNYHHFRRGASKNNPHNLVHRAVYTKFVGFIPHGHAVHHIDHNTHNNDPANLQLMTLSEHQKFHLNDKNSWYKTPEGIAWRLKHNRENNTLPRDYGLAECPICKKQFNKYHASHKYCSDECSVVSFKERHEGYDKKRYDTKNVQAVCQMCGKDFLRSSSYKKKFCDSCHKPYQKKSPKPEVFVIGIEN